MEGIEAKFIYMKFYNPQKTLKKNIRKIKFDGVEKDPSVTSED